jgi:hypothetical protein
LEGYFEIDAKQGFQALGILNLTVRMLGFSPFLNANLPSRVEDNLRSQIINRTLPKDILKELEGEVSELVKESKILKEVKSHDLHH